MTKRTRRPPPAKSVPREEARPAWPVERHSGEGSASALETLQKLEQRRVVSRPPDPHPEDDAPAKG